MKYHNCKTSDLENRSHRDYLRIIGLPEHHDKRKNLYIILQENMQENGPDILEQQGKVEIEKTHKKLGTKM